MRFRLPIIILVAALSVGMASCNSDDDSDIEIIQDTSVGNVAVTSFSLQKSVSSDINYDSLFFSIDLGKAVIFNADSLPVGTVPGNLIVDVTLPTVKKAEFVMQYADKENKVVDYLENATDSIDFGADKVLLRVVSYDEKVMREYTVKINVHKSKPDSLSWDKAAFAAVPGLSSGYTGQKTVVMGGKYYTLTLGASSSVLSVADNLGDKEWSSAPVSLPAGALVESFSVAGNKFYILDGADNLYESADGLTWTSTGSDMCYIYGGFGSELLGVRKNGGKHYHVTYPETVETEVPQGCPVSGTSALMIYDSKRSESEMAAFTGGRDAAGGLSGVTWGYDGTRWAKLSLEGMPAREGIAVCNYFTAEVNNFFEVSTKEVLYAFGGRLSNGSIDNTLYISVDRGVHWSKAADSFQFSKYAPALYGAQALVCATTKYVSTDDAVSRAVKPIVSWECPYLYVAGGSSASGNPNDKIYRAVLNQLSFVPVQ